MTRFLISSRVQKLRRFLGVLVVVGAGFSASVFGGHYSYEVTVTNITSGQILSPAVVAIHSSRQPALFSLGSPASDEVAAVAEDAANDLLLSAFEASPYVLDHGVATGVNGPILPGESTTILLDAPSGLSSKISLVGMLVTTNDAFYGLSGANAPFTFSTFFGLNGQELTYLSPAYDAGTEFNSEDCDYIPGPPCGNGGAHDFSTEAEGFVHVHNGIHGGGDLDPADWDWRNPVAKITVRVVKTGQ